MTSPRNPTELSAYVRDSVPRWATALRNHDHLAAILGTGDGPLMSLVDDVRVELTMLGNVGEPADPLSIEYVRLLLESYHAGQSWVATSTPDAAAAAARAVLVPLVELSHLLDPAPAAA